MPSCTISSASLAFRVIAISSGSQPKPSARPRRTDSIWGSSRFHIVCAGAWFDRPRYCRMASCTTRGLGLTPPLLRLMSVRSTVKACWISSQKSSSCATSSGVLPSVLLPRLTTRASAWSRRAGTAAGAANRDRRNARRVVMSGSFGSAEEQATVRHRVDRHHHGPEHELEAGAEAGGVHDGNQVMLDEAAAVAGQARPGPEVVLERRERAHPARVFDHGAPDGERDVHPRHAPPTPGEEPAEHDEDDREAVCQDDQVREQAPEHP